MAQPPRQLNLHAWCLGELLPLKGLQLRPSTSQSGPFLKYGAEKIRWISPLSL